MFEAILNRIAERSQALKDKDAEIATFVMQNPSTADRCRKPATIRLYQLRRRGVTSGRTRS